MGRNSDRAERVKLLAAAAGALAAVYGLAWLLSQVPNVTVIPPSEPINLKLSR